MTEPAIKVSGLSKQYRIGHQKERYATLRDAIMNAVAAPVRRLKSFGQSSHRPEDSIWALQDVSFEVQPGEVIGVVGKNGAGKTTLLKILSEITNPTEGRVELRGRVGSLLEVGTGFHPELTGRENIFLNGAILGMTRAEIRWKFDDIVEFSEISKFIDTPVKRYSSGMYVRLAFAVAAHLEPEILLVDEVLAVGDVSFQRKCIGKMNDVARSGRTVLFVSHNMATIESLCPKTLLLREGRVAAMGPTEEVLEEYLGDVSKTSRVVDLTEHSGRRTGSRKMMKNVALLGEGGDCVSSVRMGGSVAIRVAFECADAPIRPVLGVTVKSLIGAPVFGVNNRLIKGYRFDPVTKGTITCHMDDLPLMPGTFIISLYFGDEHQSLDVVLDAISFDVVQSDVFGTGKLPSPAAGPIYWPAKWSLLGSGGEKMLPKD